MKRPVEIHAGHACELVAKRGRSSVRRDLVQRARMFGIYRNDLELLSIKSNGYQHQVGTLIVRNLKTGTSTFIEQFKNGDLGIRLNDGDEPNRNPGNPAGPLPPRPPTPTRNPPLRFRGDPLFIDLTGQGLGAASTSGLAANLHVDLDGDGFAEKAGWVTKNAGVLVLDKDANRQFTDGQELFGDFTRLAGGQLAANGFQALSQFDRNRDGVIDANDAVWSSLKVARYETNQFSGQALISDPDAAMSLVSLGELGITAIHLANTLIVNPLKQADGNTKVRSGTIEWTLPAAAGDPGGASVVTLREVAEYRLTRDEGDTRFTQWRDETPDITALPELKLGGRVMDLHQALIRDADATGYKGHQQGALRAALDAYLGASDPQSGSGSGSQASAYGNFSYANRQTAFDILINMWIGIDTIPPEARSGGLSLRQATVLEQVYGPGYQNTFFEQTTVWDPAYRRLIESVYASLTMQTHLKDDYARIEWRVQPELVQEIGYLEQATAAFKQRLTLAIDLDAAASAAGGTAVTSASDVVRTDINEFGRIIRGLDITRDHCKIRRKFRMCRRPERRMDRQSTRCDD